MKKVIFFLSLIVVILHFSYNMETIDTRQTINPIIGDISFIKKFGHHPDVTTDEDLRVKTHLEYVENFLRQKNLPGLSSELLQKRKQLLNLLHDYRIAGSFPRNYDYQNERKPCFIDKDNRICAVGYLIEKTAGRPIAEEINSKHKYDRLLAMNDNMVDSWIKNSGLTKEECAMIQPAYGGTYVPTPTYSSNYISPAYGISSSVFSGANLSLNTINSIQVAKGANNKTTAILGLISGTGQTILGVSMFPKTTPNSFYDNGTKESRKTLSMVNIGLGTTTMILSTWNLITNKKPKDKKTKCSLSSFETPSNNIGIAFTLRRKL